MTKVFIFHGVYGYPGEAWFPRLKNLLTKAGHEVYIPDFPTPNNQSLPNWMMIFEKYRKYLDHDSIFVGHGLGVAFGFRVLETTKWQIKAFFAVGGWISRTGYSSADTISNTFLNQTFDRYRIKKHCEKFIVYGSDNDMCANMEKTTELAQALDVEPKIINNAGHFNEGTRFEYRFDPLRKDLKMYL